MKENEDSSHVPSSLDHDCGTVGTVRHHERKQRFGENLAHDKIEYRDACSHKELESECLDHALPILGASVLRQKNPACHRHDIDDHHKDKIHLIGDVDTGHLYIAEPCHP